MVIQADCPLTYLGNNIFQPTDFCQALLHSNNIAIPEPNAPTGLSMILTPPLSAGLENAQQRAIIVQVLLAMEQDQLSKEELVEFLDHRIHVVATTQ